MTRSLLALLALALVPALAVAQTPGSCTLGVAQADLATPDLSARLFNMGSLFFGNGSQAAYTVPRGRGTSPVFAAGLWAGGRVNGEVRTAGGNYGAPSLAFTFWPGPLDAGAALPNPADCSAYDRIWLVTPQDVAAVEAGGTPSTDLREWPVGLGAPAVNAQGQPVPVVSRGQILDLAGGERPVLGGGPTAFWVMNDVGNVRTEAGQQPLGIEVQVTAFAPAVGALVFRQSTFYRYTVVNRNSVPITDFHVGFFSDPDLGDATDDRVGADTTRGMAYVYNADNEDGGNGSFPTYGTPPPAFGFDLLTGFYGSSYFASSQSSGNADPRLSSEVYNRLRGLWSDGSVIRAYGNGYQQTQGQVVRTTYPGDPVTGTPWSEVNPGGGFPPNPGGDRRFMLSATPVTLAPGASTTVDLALVFAQGADYLDSITALRAASDLVQAAHDDGTLFSGQLGVGTAAAPTLIAPAENASFYETPVTFSWAPVAGATGYTIEISPTADFATVDGESVSGTSVTLSPTHFPGNRTEPVFWRVRTTQGSLDGPPSASRAVRVYRYVRAPLTLASGALAYVETTAPGGGPACEPNDPDEGCSEVGGDLVFESLNSTGAYRMILRSSSYAPYDFAPNDFEIRFTARGSYAYAASGNSTDVQRLFRVPFEAWDIGPTAPGSVNDPSDDVQLIVRLTRTSTEAEMCRYDFVTPVSGGSGPVTRFMTTYYPVGNDYAAYDALAAAAVAADPAGCPTANPTVAAARALADVPRGRPLDGFQFEKVGAQSIADLDGAIVRFYTSDRAVASEGAPAAASALRLGAAFPNPATASLTVPVSLPTAGRLRLVDVLGRSVVDVRLEAGEQRVRLDTRAIAAGVYAVVLESETGRAVRTVTVVR